jgi:hypothetical protein
MEVTAPDLRQRYESLEDDELVRLILNTELTDTASSVLRDVLSNRGITEDRLKELEPQKGNEIVDQVPRKSIVRQELKWILFALAIGFGLKVLFAFF